MIITRDSVLVNLAPAWHILSHHDIMMYRFKLWILAALVPSASCAKLDSEAGVPVKSNSVLQTQHKVAIWMQAAVDREIYIYIQYIYITSFMYKIHSLNTSWDYSYQLKLDIPSSLNAHTLYCNHFTKFHVLRDLVGNSRCIVVHKSCYVANSGEEKSLCQGDRTMQREWNPLWRRLLQFFSLGL